MTRQRPALRQQERLTLLCGDCRDVMAGLPECCIDAIVSDPPYDLTAGKKGGTGPASENLESPYGRARITTGFMGKGWDGTGVAFDPETWHAALHVLKPGGHLLAFGGPRTFHRLACAIEDAGFEVRDCLMWLFGSGFPKSLDVSKAIDKAAGAERSRYERAAFGGSFSDDGGTTYGTALVNDPATPEAARWQGWGTALKPAYEPIILARKPLQGTVAANVQRWDTGALNIEACRIGMMTPAEVARSGKSTSGMFGLDAIDWKRDGHEPSGRWPANVLLDTEAARLLDAMSGESASRQGEPRIGANGDGWGLTATGAEYADHGGASRFFYTAKASRSEREFGLDDLEPARRSDGREKDIENPRLRTNARRNDHPTVKPVDLMRWLVRLVTPPDGTVLDPFMGSGSTGMAVLDEGFNFIGIDMDEHYIEIARRRINRRALIEALPQLDQGQGVLL